MSNRSAQPMALALLLLCSACGRGDGPAVIDGGSKEAFEASLAEARRDLGPKDRVKLELAIGEFKARMFAKAANRQHYDQLVRDGLDGLTAPAIVSKFDENATKLGNDAADAVFEAKEAIKR